MTTSSGILIDDESVSEGRRFVENAYDSMSECKNKVVNSYYNLDDEAKNKIIGIHWLYEIESLLQGEQSHSKKIMAKCDEFINEQRKMVNSIKGLSVPNITSLGKGSLNPEFVKNPESFLINKLNSDNNDVNDSNNVIISDEEYSRIMLALAYENDSELPSEVIKSMIDECKYLNGDDKNYINNQLDIGNVRSAIGYILEMQARDELEAKKAIQKECEKKLVDYSVIHDKRTSSEEKELKELRRKKQQATQEVKQQEMVVNRYAKSRKQWEYDYVLALLEKGEFNYNATDIRLSLNNIYNEYTSFKENGRGEIVYKHPDGFSKGIIYKNADLYLNDDELKIYYYLVNNVSEEEGKNYLELFSDYYNSQIGLEKANEIFNEFFRLYHFFKIHD